VNLTPGDWDVSAILDIQANGATTTVWYMGISATSGNSAAGLSSGDNQSSGFLPTASLDGFSSIPPYRVSINSSTPYYLKYYAVYSVATPKATCRLSARRVR
jgi:hypothetical protein